MKNKHFVAKFEYVSDREVTNDYYLAEALVLPFGGEPTDNITLKLRMGPGKCLLNPGLADQDGSLPQLLDFGFAPTQV